MNTDLICSDCECSIGELHDDFCSKELCPFCQRQLVGCECVFTQLNLNDEEREAYEDYIDDEEEPLKSILERWELKLANKGRIPFGKDLEILGVSS